MRTKHTTASPLWFVATLVLALAGAGHAATLVQLDINDVGTPADTQAGFTPLLSTDVDAGAGDTYSKSIGAILVDIDATAAGLDDRHRIVPTDAGSLTQSALYRDFVFNTSSGAGSANGLDVIVSGLTPNRNYDLTFWSYDNGSGGDHISDWYVNGVFALTHTFNGGTLPTDDADYRFTLAATADALGSLSVTALPNANGASSFNVFLNAIQIDEGPPPVPEPVTASLGVFGLAGLAWATRRRRGGKGRVN